MPSRVITPSNLTLYVAHEIEREKETVSYQQLADRWEVSKAHLVNVSTHLHGVGPELEQKLADAWTGGSRDKLQRLADEWRRQHPAWRPRNAGRTREVHQSPDQQVTYGDLPGAATALQECLNVNSTAPMPVPEYWFHGALTMAVVRMPASGRISAAFLRVLAQFWRYTSTREMQAAVQKQYSEETV